MSEIQKSRESAPTPTRTIGEWTNVDRNLTRLVEESKTYPNHGSKGIIFEPGDLSSVRSVTALLTGEITVHPDLANNMNVMAIQLDEGRPDGDRGFMTFTGHFRQDQLDSIGAQLVAQANQGLEMLESPQRLPEIPYA